MKRYVSCSLETHMLQPVDIAIAYLAAVHDRRGGWTPKVLREDLRVPWSSLHLALGRLEDAGIIRGGRVSRQSLAVLLPVLQYLVPIRPHVGEPIRGVPTGASSPGLPTKLIVSTPHVWPSERGAVEGHPITPLFRTIPEVALDRPVLHTLFGALDAARTGRARELRLAHEVLGELARLPAPMAA